MEIEIKVVETKIAAERHSKEPLTGALVEFTGIVRGEEEGLTISALRYEAYQPMAENIMREILERLEVQYPCLKVTVHHRIGVVPVNEIAIYIGVEAVHRGEAFAMAANFMNQLKEEVPIWKTEVIP